MRLPPHYSPESTRDWHYAPDHRELLEHASAWRREHSIHAAGDDTRHTHLLLIDVQRDFCFPEGTLFAAGRSGTGALDDNQRIAEFIYRHLDEITAITTTHDTHHAFQIFTPTFWIDPNGEPPAEHREVSTDDIQSGRLRPNPAMAAWLCDGNVDWLQRYVLHYTRSLEAEGKYSLYLWPPHCILGSEGHVLSGAIHEARLFHAYTRSAQSFTELKGDHALTENYSVFVPEVTSLPDGSPFAQRNARLMRDLLRSDHLVIAGQAASHCVKWSIDDLIDEVQASDPSLLKKITLLVDCMSAVTVPDGKGGLAVDFTPQVEETLERYSELGIRLARSADGL